MTRPAASGGATDGERDEHTRLDDEYVKPRYPVDEPPTYRARCTCGWFSPERYRGITDGDWQQHISVASQADGEEMREELERWLRDRVQVPEHRAITASYAFLALPAVRRLLDDAAKVQRVRELLALTPNDRTVYRSALLIALEGSAEAALRRALDGDTC